MLFVETVVHVAGSVSPEVCVVKILDLQHPSIANPGSAPG